MIKTNDYYLSSEDKKMARRENASFHSFIIGIFPTCIFGVISFFLVWRLHATLPDILIDYLPGRSHSNPYRLYELLVITIGGFSWFICCAVLWFKMAKHTVSIKRRGITLGIWCAVCAVIFAAVEIGYRAWLFG